MDGDGRGVWEREWIGAVSGSSGRRNGWLLGQKYGEQIDGGKGAVLALVAGFVRCL